MLQDEKNSYFQRRLEQVEQENDQLKDVITQMNIIVTEFVPRLSVMTGKKEKGMRITGVENGGFDLIRQVLEGVEEKLQSSQQENNHLKERLQELLQQLDIYKNEISSTKELDKRKGEMKEEHLKKEIEGLKREKEKLGDRNLELARALKEVTEDFKF
mmetsp:Transcript_9740/g.9487  ORF Transcript_9740/g.9487 Transcript_9740/m.9487 type:complete len:158 (+) Transcript_9740:2520-2993(+)